MQIHQTNKDTTTTHEEEGNESGGKNCFVASLSVRVHADSIVLLCRYNHFITELNQLIDPFFILRVQKRDERMLTFVCLYCVL